MITNSPVVGRNMKNTVALGAEPAILSNLNDNSESIQTQTKDHDLFQYVLALTGGNTIVPPLGTTFLSTLESREKALKMVKVNHSSLHTKCLCSAVQGSYSQLLGHAK